MIHNLLGDIRKVLTDGVEVPDELANEFGENMKDLIKTRLRREKREPTLRMSSMGKPNRQLWYEMNLKDHPSDLRANTYMKFLIGDIIENVVIALAKISGHKVEGEQQEMTLAGIKGHRDVVIDGVTVDVKSASPYSFQKFQEGLKPEQDSFGYLTQINSYVTAAKDDPIVTNKDEGAFLVVQKVTGDITLDIHKKTTAPLEDIFEYKKKMISEPEPPERCFEPEPFGKSGNMKLGVNCSYCPFKFHCWDGLRAFHYSNGPVFLTEVTNEPKVAEFDRDGKIIHKYDANL